jgi:peroxiredoxin
MKTAAKRYWVFAGMAVLIAMGAAAQTAQERLPSSAHLTKPGETLPAIDAMDTEGKPVRWGDYRGKPFVVMTWATWCSYCKQAMPSYEKTRRAVRAQGVEFVLLSFDEDASEYQRWLAAEQGKYGFRFAHVRFTNIMDALKQFHADIPSFFVVDKDGRVVSSYLSFRYGTGADDPRLTSALRAAGVRL